MKIAPLADVKARLSAYVDECESEGPVIITRNGKPIALVVGMEFKDEEDFALETSPEFWKMIEERRRQPTVSMDEVRTELFGEKSGNQTD